MNPEPSLVILQHAVQEKEKIIFVSSNKDTKVTGFALQFAPKNIIALHRTALDTFLRRSDQPCLSNGLFPV